MFYSQRIPYPDSPIVKVNSVTLIYQAHAVQLKLIGSVKNDIQIGFIA